MAKIISRCFSKLNFGRKSENSMAQPKEYRRRSEYVVNEDVSNGREENMLPALSYAKNDCAPFDYHYVTEHVQYDKMDINQSIADMSCCTCLDDCSSSDCPCSKTSSGVRQYSSRNRLSSGYSVDSPEMLQECNAACRCNRKTCKNMVVQNGCKARMALIRTRSRGWGVRTLEKLKRGAFVGIYSGELISMASSHQRQDDTYLFNLGNTHLPDQQQQQQLQQQQEDNESAMSEVTFEDESNPQLIEDKTDVVDGEKGEQQQSSETNIEEQQKEEKETKSTDDGQYVCDARYFGNFTRFINHSCKPNVVGIRTLTSHQDIRFPHIAFFTNTDLPANAELTLNYGDNYWRVKCKRDKVYCLCKQSNCKFSKENFLKTQSQKKKTH